MPHVPKAVVLLLELIFLDRSALEVFLDLGLLERGRSNREAPVIGGGAGEARVVEALLVAQDLAFSLLIRYAHPATG